MLVTGASGFVGAQIVRQLIRNGHALRLVARPAAAARLASQFPDAEIVSCGDVFAQSPQWWEKACDGVNAIIHAAWYVNPADYLDSEQNATCVSGTFRMAQGAVAADVQHFVGLGTCMEYALPSEQLSIDAPTAPATVYGASKLALFEILDGFFKTTNVRFSWCRLFYLFGEGENPKRLYPYLSRCLAAGEPATLGSGTQLRDYLDVAVGGAAIADIVDTGQVGAINVCSGQPVSIRAFAESIADRYGRRDLLEFGAHQPHPRDPPAVVGVPNFAVRVPKKEARS
ncbi:NAD-dependent epimerase/dehydratase family protein [Hoeflea sp.]|uniref:NAD-dependent epimerase/dehydratase family protein n=1 Tax=Hoeflea sp. TaxID=1940281 RepID=UPI0037482731